MNGILWGLLGAIFIGASDCIARVTSQKVAVSILFTSIMGVSLIALTLWLGVSMNCQCHPGTLWHGAHPQYQDCYRSTTLVWPTGTIRRLVVTQAILETAALAAFLVGSVNGGRVVATIGFSTFAAATALFAWWWLGEEIGWQRGLWIVVTGCGVLLAALGSP